MAYGAADMNAAPTDMSERKFRTIYLEPWRRLIQAGTVLILDDEQLAAACP